MYFLELKNTINFLASSNTFKGDLLYTQDYKLDSTNNDDDVDGDTLNVEIKLEKKYSIPSARDLKEIKNRKDIYHKVIIQNANIKDSLLSQAPSEIEKPEAIENIRKIFFLRDKYRFEDHSNCK